MCTEKKSIMTKHNGILFRSRLEARFAVFLEELHIKYDYETEGFELSDGTKYLPDFYLPGYDRWVECKGVMEDYDAHKIAMLEKDFCTHMIIVDQSLNLFLSDGTPLYLDCVDFTTEPIELTDVSNALEKAKKYRFEGPDLDVKAVDGDKLTRLIDLKLSYLQDAWYVMDYKNEKIVNVVNDTRGGTYTETDFLITVTSGDRLDFMVTLSYKDKELFHINVYESEVKDICKKVFRMAYELLIGMEEKSDHKEIFYTNVEKITTWLAERRLVA